MQHYESLDHETMLQQSLGAHAVFAKNAIVFCNRAFESITGYSRRELAAMEQRALSVVFKGGDGDLLHRLIRLCCKGEQVSYHPEVRIVKKNGDIGWIEIALCSLMYQKKTAAHLSCIDKTEDKNRYDAVSGMTQACWEMLNTAAILAVMFDPRGMVVFCNDSMLEAIGWQREDILGRNWFDECVAEQSVGKLHRESIAGQTVPPRGEYDLVTKDGFRRTFAWSSTILRDGAGDLSGVMTIGEDRTELKRAELELRELQREFAGVIDYTDDGISLVDEEGTVVAWNRGIERITGLFRNETLGKPLWEALYRTARDESKSPETLERIKLCIEEMLARGEAGREPGNAVETIRRPDGMRKKVRRAFFTIPSARGFRGGAIMKDATELTTFRETVTRWERDYRLLAESIPGLLFLISRDGTILYVNNNGAGFLAKPVEAIIGKKQRDVFPPRFIVPLESLCAQVFESGGEITSELLLHDRWLFARFVPSKDLSGVFPAVLIVADDITRRKNSEGQLRDARERSETAVREKGECVARVSDAIRTPLYGIAGMADLLLTTTALDGPQREFASDIERSSRLLLREIDDIFDLSKIEAGTLSLEFAPLDLHGIIRDVVESLTPSARAKEAGITLRYAKKLPRTFMGDGGRIRQILLNLVGVALRFAGRGHVTIDVDGEALPGDVFGVHLRLRSTGVTLSLEERNALFSPSARPDGAAAGRSRRRLEWGLSISQMIAAMMNGAIDVETSADAGSTFALSLTLAAASVKTGETGRKQTLEPTHGATPAGIRVLVVVDDDISRRVACSLFNHCGCDVEAVSNGREAVERINSAPFDLIVIDCRRNEPDGYDTACRIRRLKGRHLKSIIVAMTAGATREERIKRLEAGMDDVIVKPLTQQAVRELIRRHYASPLCGGKELSGTPDDEQKPLPVFSAAKIRSITGNDPAAIRKLVDLTVRTYPPMLQHLDESITADHLDKAASIAQGLTASAGSIGALRVAETAAAIVIAAKDNQAGSCRKMAMKLRKENDRLLRALREMTAQSYRLA